MSQDPIAILAIVVAVGGSILAWLLSDARARGRNDVQTEKAKEIERDVGETRNTLEMLYRLSVAAEADRKSLHSSVQQLSTEKASRDSVDGLDERLKEMRMENTQHFRELRDLISQKENSGAFSRIPKTGV